MVILSNLQGIPFLS